MKRIKQIFLLSALILFLGLGLTACGGSDDASRSGSHELVGEWEWDSTGQLWFRFYEDGSAVNLRDGEEFTWNEDGSLNALIYESWSIRNNTLTITWSTGATFDYNRAD